MTLFEARLKCPECGGVTEERMPLVGAVDAWMCRACGREHRTPSDGCCIYCAFSDVFCPSRQQSRDCCSG